MTDELNICCDRGGRHSKEIVCRMLRSWMVTQHLSSIVKDNIFLFKAGRKDNYNAKRVFHYLLFYILLLTNSKITGQWYVVNWLSLVSLDLPGDVGLEGEMGNPPELWQRLCITMTTKTLNFYHT